MPELAEVEFFRSRWNPALGKRIASAEIHPRARCCRGISTTTLQRAVSGRRLLRSQAAAKQMAFIFEGGVWIGVHLGMTGQLLTLPRGTPAAKHDHLVLRLARGPDLVFRDPRMFGRIQLWQGKGEPPWWSSIPPPLLSEAFTLDVLADFLRRRARSPLKAVLLMQERFPGIGNWMADEILWRAGLHPAAHAGVLGPRSQRRLHAVIREVCTDALRVIGKDWSDPPDTWLFNHRWEKGGRCPRTRGALVHATIGGRTTCWSPRRQVAGTERR